MKATSNYKRINGELIPNSLHYPLFSVLSRAKIDVESGKYWVDLSLVFTAEELEEIRFFLKTGGIK